MFFALMYQPSPPYTRPPLMSPATGDAKKSFPGANFCVPRDSAAPSGASFSRFSTMRWKYAPSSPAGVTFHRPSIVAMNRAVVSSPRDGVLRPSISSAATNDR